MAQKKQIKEIVGSVMGYTVRKTDTHYIFGCGAVKLPHEKARNFVKELKIQRGEAPRTQQQRDYEFVLAKIQQRDDQLLLTEEKTSRLIKIFEVNGKSVSKCQEASQKSSQS